MDAPRTAAAGVGQRSKIPAPVQASLEAKLAQLEEIRRKRLELELLLTGGLSQPQAAKPASEPQPHAPLGPNLNAQNAPAHVSRLPVPQIVLDNSKTGGTLLAARKQAENKPVTAPRSFAKPAIPARKPEPAPAVPKPVLPPPAPTVVEVAIPEPEAAVVEEPAPTPAPDVDVVVAPAEEPVQMPAVEPARPTELPKPMDISQVNSGPGGRSNVRSQVQPHQHTPYHSRSLRLRALAATATPEPPAAAKAKAPVGDKGDEWTAATRKNTQNNKGHHAKLIITLVHREGPRPASPSQALRDKNMDFNAAKLPQPAEDLTPVAETPVPGGRKKVRWTANEVIDETQPPQAAKPPTKAQGMPHRRPIIRVAGDGTDANGNQPLSPPIVTIQRFVYVEAQQPAPPISSGGGKRKKT